MFLSYNYVQAKIPYCSGKVTKGCVQSDGEKTSKFYYAPKHKVSNSFTKVKSSKSKKWATVKSNNKKKPIRNIASVADSKAKKKKSKLKY